MSKVWYKPLVSGKNRELSDVAGDLLSLLVSSCHHEFTENVPIKVHFGEKGNKTFVASECYEGIIDYLKNESVNTAYIETNVLYRGSRTTSESHKALALEHGFDQIPIVIADGERGEAFEEVEIGKKYFETCKLGKAFGNYSQFIVTSHFKGHGLAGFGGALKQLAMGFASRGGKLAQHSEISPRVSSKRCTSCGLCIEKCDVDAIIMEEKAKIVSDKCVGCAGCIAVCPVGAISNAWDGHNFKQKVAEYAYGAAKGKDNIYINFLINITEECDCMGQVMTPIAKDIGVLASKDPVALDAACLDLLQSIQGKRLFDSGRETIDHAVEIGLGSSEFELIEV